MSDQPPPEWFDRPTSTDSSPPRRSAPPSFYDFVTICRLHQATEQRDSIGTLHLVTTRPNLGRQEEYISQMDT